MNKHFKVKDIVMREKTDKWSYSGGMGIGFKDKIMLYCFREVKFQQ